jgi:ribA/ribD-fused uncharacterized protein
MGSHNESDDTGGRERRQFRSMVECEHANESPRARDDKNRRFCTCPSNCGCREHMCPRIDSLGRAVPAKSTSRLKIDSFRGNYRFLSNFFPALCNYEGIVYPTVEHGYQAAKSLNQDVRKTIAGALTSQEAKALGRNVVLRPDWESVKIQVMRDLIALKFSNREIANLLRLTGDAELIEGNWWGDTFWGVCNGVGENWLGRLLMEQRDLLNGK